MKKLFRNFKRFLTAGPKIDDLADQAGRQRRSFYFGTAYLTFHRVIKYLIIAFLFVLFLGFGFAGGYAVGIIRQEPIPSVEELHHELINNDNSATIYYAHQVRLAKVRPETTIKPVRADELSPLLKQAVIATEDENFYQHHGILPKSIVRAVLSEVTGVGVQTGGSTLTQQLVKMRFLSNQTTWHRKIVEMFYARKIERYFPKDDILLSYLNAAPYGKNNAGENITGVKTAAVGIFGKPVNQLNLPEIAFIAGLPQSPSTYTPYGLHGKLRKNLSLGMERKNIVLFRMYRNGDISKHDYQAAVHYDLKKDFLPAHPKKIKKQTSSYIYNLVTNKADNLLANYLIKQDGRKVEAVKHDHELYQQYLTNADQLMHQKGYHVQTTFDKRLYRTMQNVLQQTNLGQDHVSRDFDTSKNKYVRTTEHVENGSVMIDNHTGKILAFTGGVDFKDSQVNHAFDTYRSPGSSIKPYLVYGPAVQHGLISNRTQLADFPTHFGKYIPTDYNQTIQNRFLSVQRALYMSYNLPAVNLYKYLRENRIQSAPYMDKLGFDLKASEYKKLGLALGGTDYGFTVAQNASAFSTFYNQGRRADPYYIAKITAPSGKVIYRHHVHSQRVFSKGTAYIMRHMLHQVVKQGTGSTVNGTLQMSRKTMIGKTGTSNNYRDIWFNGSTPGITISSWIGYDNFYGHNYNLNENSSDANLDLWAAMVNQLYRERPSVFKLHETFSRPRSVQVQSVLKKTGTKPGIVDFDGDQIRLHGQEVTALSLKPAAPATSKFGIGASDRDYRLFYDHEQGEENDYGQPLAYSGKTISKKHNLKDLFTPVNGPVNDEEYYGHRNQAESKSSSAGTAANVGANDQAAQTSGSAGPGTGGSTANGSVRATGSTAETTPATGSTGGAESSSDASTTATDNTGSSGSNP